MKTTTKQQQNKHAKSAVPLAIYKHITEIKKYLFFYRFSTWSFNDFIIKHKRIFL